MHRALYISEVLADITDHLGRSRAYGTLADLGVTCKALFLPALSCLWTEVSFWDFIELLGDLLPPSEHPDEPEGSQMRRVMVGIRFRLY